LLQLFWSQALFIFVAAKPREQITCYTHYFRNLTPTLKPLTHIATFLVARNTAKKEEMAENCKHQTRIIWGDFMKPKNQEDMAKCHNAAHAIMLAGSAVKQDLHREDGEKLVAAANDFAEIFWASKGVKTKKVTTPYAPNIEVVEPDL